MGSNMKVWRVKGSAPSARASHDAPLAQSPAPAQAPALQLAHGCAQQMTLAAAGRAAFTSRWALRVTSSSRPSRWRRVASSLEARSKGNMEVGR
eukprot:scaffold87941_cov30-Tisochrysis_lutea.AAC.3